MVSPKTSERRPRWCRNMPGVTKPPRRPSCWRGCLNTRRRSSPCWERRAPIDCGPVPKRFPFLWAEKNGTLFLPRPGECPCLDCSRLRDYANLGLPLLDLVSEGNIGLMKAVERFDPAKGGKLSTYAAWWIKQSIKRALANQSKTIRLPVHLVDKISKMRRVALQMSEELGREPTDEELAEEVGMASAKVSQLKTVSIRPASLDAPISDDDTTEFGEIVGDLEALTPFERLRDKNLRDEVGDLLEVLDEREKKIIFSRFGLDGGKAKTLEEVGKKFGVTRERIRQLQNIALRNLRRALQKKEKPIEHLLPAHAGDFED